MSIESVMLSNHLILCRPLLLLPPIFPSIRVFSVESAFRIRWPKYRSFSFNISPSVNTQDWSPVGWTGWISLQSKGLSRVFFYAYNIAWLVSQYGWASFNIYIYIDIIYLFIGYAGSSLLSRAFCSCSKQDYSELWCTDFSLWCFFLLWSTGLRAHGLSGCGS